MLLNLGWNNTHRVLYRFHSYSLCLSSSSLILCFFYKILSRIRQETSYCFLCTSLTVLISFRCYIEAAVRRRRRGECNKYQIKRYCDVEENYFVFNVIDTLVRQYINRLQVKATNKSLCLRFLRFNIVL